MTWCSQDLRQGVMRQIRLSKGLYALVDGDDFWWLMQWTWCASHESRGSKWYAIRFEIIDGKRTKIRMHRAIIERHHKLKVPVGHVVDHVNHNSLDNRKQNLEVITQTENMRRSPGWKKRGQKVASTIHKN
jgi:hypothetical protein